MRTPRSFRIREFLRADGSCPYREWLASLDVTVRARLQARVLRLESGNFGDRKLLGGGISELRCDFGPGYRVYFGIDGGTVVLLLFGGDKSSQRRDIRTAQTYWNEYLEENQNG